MIQLEIMEIAEKMFELGADYTKAKLGMDGTNPDDVLSEVAELKQELADILKEAY